jgi:hypothetical protein
MGNTHNNIILKGPPQVQILAYLEQQKQGAFVSPTLDGLTFVYASDDGWAALAEDLSRTCRCIALFASVYDSDVLEYTLYDQGRQIDMYNSAPYYFDGERWMGDEPDAEAREHQPTPLGGNAHVLCTAFAVDHAIEQVEKILHPALDGPIRLAGMDAFHQHWALAEALGWPPQACVVDYEQLDGIGVDQDLVDAFGGAPPIKTPA